MPVTKVKFLSKVARITVASKPYQSLKNCWIGIVSLVLSMEPTRGLFLDTTRGLTVPQSSVVLAMTATASWKNFLE